MRRFCQMTFVFVLFAVPLALAAMPTAEDIVLYSRGNGKINVWKRLDDRAEGDALLFALRDLESFEPFAPQTSFVTQGGGCVRFPVSGYTLTAMEPGNPPVVHRFEFLPGTDAETGAPVWCVRLEHVGDGLGREPDRLVPPDAAAILQSHFDAWDIADRSPFAKSAAAWDTVCFQPGAPGVAGIPRPPPGGTVWLRRDFWLDFKPDGHVCELSLPLFSGRSEIYFNGIPAGTSDGPISDWRIHDTGALREGRNTLVVCLDFSSPDAAFIEISPSEMAFRAVACKVVRREDRSLEVIRTPLPPSPLDGEWKCLVWLPELSAGGP